MSSTDNREVLLRVEDLCQYFRSGRYENRAVDGVSFDIKKGEVFGLVGESGSGKTTTGRCIIKIYDITSGSISFKGQRICAGIRSYKDAIKAARRELRSLKGGPEHASRREALRRSIRDNKEEIRKAQFDNRNTNRLYAVSMVEKTRQEYGPKLEAAKNDPAALKELKKEYRDALHAAKKARLTTRIQMIFQDPSASLDPRMTVREIIAEGLVINGVRDRKYIDEKVFEILETVGLSREHAGCYPHEFSGGQRQRIAIARSVIMKPDLLIADEPISALDVSIQAQVINLLNDLRDQLGLAVLFIAHDLSVVRYFSDRIGVMYGGRIVELAPSGELFARPMHPYTRSLLSAIPVPDPKTEKRRTRIIYSASAACDDPVEKPSLREIIPGHFVYCGNAEEKTFRAELGPKAREDG